MLTVGPEEHGLQYFGDVVAKGVAKHAIGNVPLR